jgi:hypothetical protein
MQGFVLIILGLIYFDVNKNYEIIFGS